MKLSLSDRIHRFRTEPPLPPEERHRRIGENTVNVSSENLKLPLAGNQETTQGAMKRTSRIPRPKAAASRTPQQKAPSLNQHITKPEFKKDMKGKTSLEERLQRVRQQQLLPGSSSQKLVPLEGQNGKNESQVNVVDNGISMGSCPESDFRTTIKVEDCQDEPIRRRSPLVISTAVDALRQEIQELEEEADHVLDRSDQTLQQLDRLSTKYEPPMNLPAKSTLCPKDVESLSNESHDEILLRLRKKFGIGAEVTTAPTMPKDHIEKNAFDLVEEDDEDLKELMRWRKKYVTEAKRKSVVSQQVSQWTEDLRHPSLPLKPLLPSTVTITPKPLPHSAITHYELSKEDVQNAVDVTRRTSQLHPAPTSQNVSLKKTDKQLLVDTFHQEQFCDVTERFVDDAVLRALFERYLECKKQLYQLESQHSAE